MNILRRVKAHLTSKRILAQKVEITRQVNNALYRDLMRTRAASEYYRKELQNMAKRNARERDAFLGYNPVAEARVILQVHEYKKRGDLGPHNKGE